MTKDGKQDLIDRPLVTAIAEGLIANDLAALRDYFAGLNASTPKVVWSPQAADLDEEVLRILLNYWTALPHGQSLPLSSAVDPMGMKAALGHIMLLEVVDDGWDFRYRVYGSAIAARSGFDATGKLVSELPIAPMAPFFMATYRACIERGAHLFARHVPPAEIQVVSWDRLILPLEDGAGQINRLLVGNVAGAWRA
ncbi:MAG: PAS domain-containing protein [Alphaproteobacteria bacterium]|jgi:hypothetical protein|nr:PAS domain-containing protein [Alphaproteobacteria bacterium]MDP6872648.1 PAS domain-containing protein [Alphaproteobacteria bacterium]